MQENGMKIRRKLMKKLTPERYEHTLGVAYTAVALAMRYECDLDQAEIAGLLHDCAKQYDDSTIYEMCQKYNISMSEAELKNKALLHTKLGAFIAMKKYQVADKEIISAILCHTTGKPDMSMLEKIVYVADYIEPRRYKAPNLPQIRHMAFIDIDHALLMILGDTLSYLKKTGNWIDEQTVKTYDYYKALLEEED